MKRKINIDRPHLSSKEIASRQDFSSLIKQLPKVTKPPFYKSGWFITTVASVAGIAVITTNFILNDKTPTLDQELTASINTEAPSTSNFVTENKNTVESDTPIILASSIDEETTNTEVNNNTEPAVSEQQLEMYETEMLEAKALYDKAVAERVAFENEAPVKPIGESDPSRQFVLDVDPQEFPELSTYKNLLFEVEASDPNFSPDVYQEEWEDIQLKTKVKGKTYYLSLFKGNLIKTFTVFPVYGGSDFEIAMAKYEKELKAYSIDLKIRKAKEIELKEDYEQKKKTFEQLSTPKI